MRERGARLPFNVISINPAAPAPLYRQLYDEFRAAILEGRLKAGNKLPPTRELATELGISRNTVMAAYDQLLSEGYVEGHVGSGTRVTSALPEEMLHTRPAPPPRGRLAGVPSIRRYRSVARSWCQSYLRAGIWELERCCHFGPRYPIWRPFPSRSGRVCWRSTVATLPTSCLVMRTRPVIRDCERRLPLIYARPERSNARLLRSLSCPGPRSRWSLPPRCCLIRATRF